MAWSTQKNDIFFRRAQDWVASLVSLLEKRNRLTELYTNEAQGDPAFVDTPIATTAELIDLAGVMNALDTLVNGGGTVANQDRMGLLTPFLADQQ